MNSFPTLSNCDQAVPAEAFQWAFVALPFEGSTPFMIQPEARQEWSQLFWDLGFRHHRELQTRKVRPPIRGGAHTLNPSVTVVDVDEPDPQQFTAPDMSDYTAHEQAIVAEQLRHLQNQGDRPDADETASVVAEQFNPADHSVSYVLGYLHHANDYERRRVIAAEMTGKRRDGIMRRYKGI
ncbi:phage gene 29 protein family protein [Nocardia colli]|uniref:phage gene 29 protein family protein n=1 Tax=Nocardia colli TaxID=2545717 RepID=UPI0035D8FD59